MGKIKGFLKNHWGKIVFVIIALIVALIGIPVLFNFVFLWDSGLSRGNTSDWFVFYGSILGGLIGGLFTYLSLLLTFNNENKQKQEEMRPRIDIPYKSFEFIDGENIFRNIVIEINNIGGSIAKNIECYLSLPNFDEVMIALENSKNDLSINLLSPKVIPIDEMGNEDYIAEYKKFLIAVNEDGTSRSLGGITKEYNSKFLGTCIPLSLNHEANAKYILEPHVSNWINYIVRNRKYTGDPTALNENELFEMKLKVKYSSIEYGDFTDYFLLKWNYIGGVFDQKIKYQYVLRIETV